MDLTKGKKLGMNVVLFGVGFTLGYYIYTGLFKQDISLPSLPPSIGKLPLVGGMVAPPPPPPVVATPPPPPTPLEIAQSNPQAVANALIYMQA